MPGYDGVYVISLEGAVYRLGRSKPMRTHVSKGGYVSLRLSKGGVTELVQIHRLLALAYLPNPQGFTEVRHLNDVKLDLRLSNLAWGTPAQNSADMAANGRNWWSNRDRCKNGHELLGENVKIRPGTNARICQACRREVSARYYRRHLAPTLPTV